MKDNNTLKIVAFGDSITLAMRQEPQNKWVNIVQDELNRQRPDIDITIVNSGVGGHTSREGLARIEEDVIAHNPDIVFVEFGGNDATSVPEREVFLDEFTANLSAIHEKAAAINARIILLTFPPVIDDWHSTKGDEKYIDIGGFDDYVEQYRQLTRQYAAENDIPLIDIDKALREVCENESPEEVILPDGVHLTTRGNKVVAQCVIEALEAFKLF